MKNWIKNEFYEMSEENFNLLLDFKIPGIIVKNFISKDICDQVAERLIQSNFYNYSHLNDIPVNHIGVCHNQCVTKEKKYYFEQREKALEQIDNIYKDLNINPVNEVLKLFNDKSGRKAEVFKEDGYGEYFAGAFRSFKGHGKLHIDHAPSHIATEWDVKKILRQLTWNIYYTVSNKGELVVYDTIHTPENEKMKVPNEYYFPYEVLDDVNDCLRMVPEVGDLIIFNTQNFHEVLGNPNGYRISQTSFFGLREDESLGFWS